MIRAVIDTNVLVSSLLSPSGNEALIVLAISQGLLTPCFSDEILREYEGVLSREKFSFPRDEVDALIRLLREEGEIVVPGSKLAGLPDPDDEKFVGVRPCCRCRFSRDREPASFPANRCGVAIVNAAGLLDRMTLDWS